MDGGAVVIRPERAEDAGFLFTLFCEHAGEALRGAGLAEAQVAPLLAMQHRAQTLAHGAYDAAPRRWIAELGGERVGRMVEADRGPWVHIVDIAVLSTARRRGVGRALALGALQAAEQRGLGISATVRIENVASRELFENLGLTSALAEDGLSLRMDRPPS